MKANSKKTVLLVGTLLAVISVLAITMIAMAPPQSGKLYKFNAKGELIRPDAQVFREWVFVGVPLTPNDMNGGKAPFPEFHNVYIDPQSWAHYKKTGEFRDGTILIKELVSVGSKSAVSGKGYFMGDFIGLEVTIKDAERFSNEPGNWAYFSFGHEYPLAEAANAQPTAVCNSCHQANATTDFVFTRYYPVLRAAKPLTSRN